LPPETASVRLAREFARRILEAAHVDRVDDVMLVASELVTNAVLHASTDLEVVIDVGTTSVRLEVADGSTQPAVKQPLSEDESGRGLVIVETLSDRWGSESIVGDGKRVWSEIGRG
jgi:anti-sigma regulatory factor (Ser/Thr protein kinase)